MCMEIISTYILLPLHQWFFPLFVGHLEMVMFLLEAGADHEHKTDEMHTALMEACMDGHVEVARLLLDSGAQVQSDISWSNPGYYYLYSLLKKF